MSNEKERDAARKVRRHAWPSLTGSYRELVEDLRALLEIIEAGSQDSTAYDKYSARGLGGCTVRVAPA